MTVMRRKGFSVLLYDSCKRGDWAENRDSLFFLVGNAHK